MSYAVSFVVLYTQLTCNFLFLESSTASGGEAVLEQLLGLVGPFVESFCECFVRCCH